MKRVFWNAEMTRQIKSGKSAEILTRQVQVETGDRTSAISLLGKAHKGWDFVTDSKDKVIIERVVVTEEGTE